MTNLSRLCESLVYSCPTHTWIHREMLVYWWWYSVLMMIRCIYIPPSKEVFGHVPADHEGYGVSEPEAKAQISTHSPEGISTLHLWGLMAGQCHIQYNRWGWTIAPKWARFSIAMRYGWHLSPWKLEGKKITWCNQQSAQHNDLQLA